MKRDERIGCLLGIGLFIVIAWITGAWAKFAIEQTVEVLERIGG